MNAVTLNPQRVTSIFMDCLFRDGEDTSTRIEAEGIACTVGFHPERLDEHHGEIVALLDELPSEFKAAPEGGGGMWFPNACLDRHGNLWTGMHQTMEQLFQLGIAIDKAAYVVPREMWDMFADGMPYVVVR